MHHFRSIFVLSAALMAAFFVATATASRDKTTCTDCKIRLAGCEKGCKDTYSDPIKYAVCAQQDCPCEVGKDKVCRESCDIGGPGWLCFYK
ncbi:hypothetical protein SVAN01_01284 [Stagonosporopsis vannaccii]|nr:hypothetical protein SVAN01_01284 [Stagonosporopsis vannaccii]